MRNQFDVVNVRGKKVWSDPLIGSDPYGDLSRSRARFAPSAEQASTDAYDRFLREATGNTRANEVRLGERQFQGDQRTPSALGSQTLGGGRLDLPDAQMAAANVTKAKEQFDSLKSAKLSGAAVSAGSMQQAKAVLAQAQHEYAWRQAAQYLKPPSQQTHFVGGAMDGLNAFNYAVRSLNAAAS